MQNTFSTSHRNNGECFCVNSAILKHSVAMSGPCENWEWTLSLKPIIWEPRDRMKRPNFYAYCLQIYLPNQNRLFQMCAIVFVNATIFNVQISRTFCEPYISKTLSRSVCTETKRLTDLYGVGLNIFYLEINI